MFGFGQITPTHITHITPPDIYKTLVVTGAILRFSRASINILYTEDFNLFIA